MIAPHSPSLPSSRYLITGGCGFIGINLIDYLIKENPHAKIRVLDNLLVGTRRDLHDITPFSEKDVSTLNNCPEEMELVVGDVRNEETCLKCCKGVDIIVHLAANPGVALSVENPKTDMEANVLGTFNMLEAARKNNVRRFIFASSGAPVGEVEPPIHEEKVPKPVSPYGASKLAGEAYCSAYYRSFGIKTISLRFGNVYGPRSTHKNSVIAKFIKNALLGKPLEVYGDGNQTRDFIFIDDLIRAIILSVNSDIGGEIFQIATCSETTVNNIADKIKRSIERQTDKTVEVIYGSPRAGDVKRNYSDISKAKKMLGFEPRVNLTEGLKVTFDWFISSEEYRKEGFNG